MDATGNLVDSNSPGSGKPQNTLSTTQFRADMSIASSQSRTTIVSATARQNLAGLFIGDRTIAARVLRDNYRAIRNSDNMVTLHISRHSFVLFILKCIQLSKRRLGLEVVWQTSTNDRYAKSKCANCGFTCTQMQAVRFACRGSC